MANARAPYGIKEVADVTFYKLSADLESVTGTASGEKVAVTFSPSLTEAFTFDSLKVSNIEVASEETSARGGKGNPELISWSYGKEITLTLNDALIDFNTLHLMFGAKEGANYAELKEADTLTITGEAFPEYYAITGTTFMRSEATGKDEPFGFCIPKAKINVNGTLTMEAEGDPTVAELTIKAMATDLGEDKDVLIKFFKPKSV